MAARAVPGLNDYYAKLLAHDLTGRSRSSASSARLSTLRFSAKRRSPKNYPTPSRLPHTPPQPLAEGSLSGRRTGWREWSAAP